MKSKEQNKILKKQNLLEVLYLADKLKEKVGKEENEELNVYFVKYLRFPWLSRNRS